MSELTIDHKTYIENVAFIEPPAKLDILISLLKLNGNEIVSPRERSSLNPFLIPISKDPKDNSLLCYIRWPTQKETMDLQIVRTTETGIKLVSSSTDALIKRIAAESDFFSSPNSNEILKVANSAGNVYTSGDYLPLLKSGKFPALTQEDLVLLFDRYLLTSIGSSFPDCYERLAQGYAKKGDTISALVTCERSVSVFYGFGHPMTYHAKMLSSFDKYDKEAKDVARASLAMPLWTVGDSYKSLEDIVQLAGFSGCGILSELYAYRAQDPREEEVKGGLNPIQVTLDQAAHLMNAVALANKPNGWSLIREEIASKYSEGGYPKMATFIRDFA